MASKRRGGFRPPELRGTLGTLLRTTTGVVRDALQRGAREGRARLDGARASRRRHDALADLGELVLDLIRRGEIDLAELPEARDLIRELDELDDDAGGADPEPEPPRAATRRRFDDRARRPRDDDDGTVSSGATLRSTRSTAPERPRPGDPTASRAPTRPMKGAWRPQIDDAPPTPDRRGRIERWDAQPTDRIGRPDRTERPDPDAARERADREHPERAERDTQRERPDRAERDTQREHPDRAERDTQREHPGRRPTVPRDPARKGGISFDDDDDLADYMHPDDVPPKTPPRDPDDHDA